METDRILVDGSPVGYMYRDGTGWVFTAGDETPEYLAESDHVNLLSLNELANYDRAILPYLEAPPGAAFIRHGGGEGANQWHDWDRVGFDCGGLVRYSIEQGDR